MFWHIFLLNFMWCNCNFGTPFALLPLWFACWCLINVPVVLYGKHPQIRPCRWWKGAEDVRVVATPCRVSTLLAAHGPFRWVGLCLCVSVTCYITIHGTCIPSLQNLVQRTANRGSSDQHLHVNIKVCLKFEYIWLCICKTRSWSYCACLLYNHPRSSYNSDVCNLFYFSRLLWIFYIIIVYYLLKF